MLFRLSQEASTQFYFNCTLRSTHHQVVVMSRRESNPPRVSTATVIYVRPNLIVNDYHSREGHAQDGKILQNSLVEHGWIHGTPIAVRRATVPEVTEYYMVSQFSCSVNECRRIANRVAASEDLDGHVYSYSGLIRKAACLSCIKDITLNADMSWMHS